MTNIKTYFLYSFSAVAGAGTRSKTGPKLKSNVVLPKKAQKQGTYLVKYSI
jgi:hypothetical protein